jgi:biopolymer transport protein ExbD
MDEKPFETLNVIPLVDVMLAPLTMVLTTANFIATGRIPVSLPQATQAKVEKQKDKTDRRRWGRLSRRSRDDEG